MGIGDMFYGRGEKARERRAAKIRTKYADFPQMTPELLEVLARSAEMPSKEQVTLYLDAVPTGTVPRRVLIGFKLSDVASYAGVLFDDALSIRWGGYQKLRDKHLNIRRAELPFWGVQRIEVFGGDGDDGITVIGSDGKTPYRISCLGFDPQDVKAFAEEAEAARQGYAQRAQRASASAPAPAESPETKISIDSTLPPEQQLAALDQMRAVGAVPDAVYQATATKIRGTGGADEVNR